MPSIYSYSNAKKPALVALALFVLGAGQNAVSMNYPLDANPGMDLLLWNNDTKQANKKLWESIDTNNIEGAALALSGGADIEKPIYENKIGLTPFHCVASKGSYELAAYLHKWGADINKKTTVGKLTPLHLACENTREEIVRFLIENNVQLDEKTDKGQTPLDIATNKLQQYIKKCPLTKKRNFKSKSSVFENIAKQQDIIIQITNALMARKINATLATLIK
jgi:ankyrin repeat protein